MKKCPQCGNDIPINNRSCSHCGYSSEQITNNYEYGNRGKRQEKTASMIIVVIILCFFFGPVIIFLFAIMFISFLSFFSFDSATEEIPRPEVNVCERICNEDKYSYTEFDNLCYCSNGDIYDKEGNKKFNNIYEDSSNIHLAPLNIKEWKDDIFSGDTVVTVLCVSDSYSCELYSGIIYDSALKNKYKLYIFNVDQLSYEDKSYLADKEILTTFNDSYPFTFITRDNKLIAAKNGMMYDHSLNLFLEDTGVIE